jgi:hypothetical protein
LIAALGIVNTSFKDLRLTAASIFGLAILCLLLSYWIGPTPAHETAETQALTKFPTTRIAFSDRQTLQISDLPGNYKETLALDNVATLRLTAPYSREVVTLLWPTLPTITVANPKNDEKYKFPGSDRTVQIGPGITAQGLTLIGQAQRITFDATHPTRFVTVEGRIFRILLVSVNDKADTKHKMFFEYVFAISEEEPTAENRAAAISQDQEPQTPVPSTYPSDVERLLAAMRDNPVGTIEFWLPPAIDGRPNVTQLSAGTKWFLFDPVAKLVVFHMITNEERVVEIRLPLEGPSPNGNYYCAFVWNNSTGGRLHLNDRFIGDGV